MPSDFSYFSSFSSFSVFLFCQVRPFPFFSFFQFLAQQRRISTRTSNPDGDDHADSPTGEIRCIFRITVLRCRKFGKKPFFRGNQEAARDYSKKQDSGAAWERGAVNILIYH